MLSAELLEQLSEMQSLWIDSIASDSVLEEFVLKSLGEVDSNQYELLSVLRDDVVDLLVRNGEQQIRNEDRGGVRMIADGRVVDLSHLAPKYRKLFDQWQAKRWISIARDLTVTKLV
jgi:hypothetical protein